MTKRKNLHQKQSRISARDKLVKFTAEVLAIKFEAIRMHDGDSDKVALIIHLLDVLANKMLDSL